MRNYHQLIRDILDEGEYRNDRTGVGTYAVFGRQLRFDLNNGFPLVTTKHTSFRLIAAELLWFLSGSTNNEDLRELNGNDNPTIWEEWANECGDLGPIYGQQWRAWRHYDEEDRVVDEYDQIEKLVEKLKRNPTDRGHVVSAWNVADLRDMALRPCHYSFQMYVGNSNHLSCIVNLRSSDVFLGLPYNVASYALLTHMLAHVCGYGVGELIVNTGDTHLYANAIEPAKTLLLRTPLDLPKLLIVGDVRNIDDFKLDNLKLEGYWSRPAIKVAVAV